MKEKEEYITKKDMQEIINKQRKQFGITLVALVVTMIVLLILAGIIIVQLSGSKLFDSVKLSKEKYKDSQTLEENILSDYENATLNGGVVSTRDGESNPVGTIIAFAADNEPDGYLVCNGQEISRTEYSKLFNVIGTKYGAGDGSTTFKLPNLTGKFLKGSNTAGTAEQAGLPNITASISSVLGTGGGGAISKSNNGWKASVSQSANSSEQGGSLTFNASWSNSIYGRSSTVTPENISVLYCIKAK